ncbi:hypothetical protein, partial [uncultured Oscillibacter sp.]|uniref:hypothetical protein n=1 Tax=uncultured Oscillibacter sp. TaxID=876091 RepID=UPI0025D6B0E5
MAGQQKWSSSQERLCGITGIRTGTKNSIFRSIFQDESQPGFKTLESLTACKRTFCTKLQAKISKITKLCERKNSVFLLQQFRCQENRLAARSMSTIFSMAFMY